MAGLYLLGFLRLEGIKPDDRMGLGRLLTGMAFLIFAISLFPGMSGGRLGDLDAYVPVATGRRPAAASAHCDGLVWMKDQYREALDRARREGKLVFVNFTGYACTNCHWMKANMFTRPEIAAALKNFILVDLYGDGTDAASEDNQKLELAKFNTVAEPFYAILDPDEKVIATFPGLTKDPAEFLAFLQKGAARAAGAPPSAVRRSASRALDGKPVDTRRQSRRRQLLGDVVRAVHPGDPQLQQAASRFRRPRACAVVGVAMDEEGAARVKPFLEKHPMEYTGRPRQRGARERVQDSTMPPRDGGLRPQGQRSQTLRGLPLRARPPGRGAGRLVIWPLTCGREDRRQVNAPFRSSRAALLA